MQGFHTQATSSWLNSWENILCSSFDSIDQIMSSFCTYHDSSAVVTCAELWNDLVIIFHTKATPFLKPFAKQVSGFYEKQGDLVGKCLNEFIFVAWTDDETLICPFPWVQAVRWKTRLSYTVELY